MESFAQIHVRLAYLFLYLRGALDTMLSSCGCVCSCVKHSGRLIRAVRLRTGRKTKMAAFYRVKRKCLTLANWPTAKLSDKKLFVTSLKISQSNIVKLFRE